MRRALVGEVDKLPVVEEEGRQSAAAAAAAAPVAVAIVGIDVDPALITLGSNVCV